MFETTNSRMTGNSVACGKILLVFLGGSGAARERRPKRARQALSCANNQNCSPDSARIGYNYLVESNPLFEDRTLQYVVRFPAQWVDASSFERAFRNSCGSNSGDMFGVTFEFPVGCKVMVDTAIRLLSLANQLAFTTQRVRLDFAEGETGTMGYLNRMGFFDHLRPDVEVLPARPAYSAAAIHRGGNQALVEIARINKDTRDEELPTRLTAALMRSCGRRPDASELEGAAWTIFAELIDNTFVHSRTRLDGYAALQVYSGGNRLSVAVSDSGLGIMETLRPSLATEFPKLTGLSDTDLLVEVFRQGLSRHGSDRGCGLKGCAAKAIKFNADLDVRLPNQRVLLTPARGTYQPNVAHCYEHLPLIWGTHIAFAFGLGA